MNADKARKYMEIVNAVARLSKDTSTKVGAIIVGQSNEVRSLGYNGAPRGCSADEDSRGRERPEKYRWLEHGERNAIYNAARIGTPLDGSSIVITHPPCMECARAIVQVGIKKVFCPKPEGTFAERWKEDFERIHRLFGECNVELIWI